jgi:hypothetical protein
MKVTDTTNDNGARKRRVGRRNSPLAAHRTARKALGYLSIFGLAWVVGMTVLTALSGE